MVRTVPSLLLMLALAGVCRAEQAGDLDWNAWRHMPAFGEDRVLPVDTFARETVEAICGRVDPTLTFGDTAPRRFTAAELLLSWLVEPEKWENVPFLAAADEALRRDVLALPLRDEQGRRLCYASPVEVENSAELGRRWSDLQKRAEAAGSAFRPAGVEKQIKNLVEAYEKFRLLSFNPLAQKVTPRRFYTRLHAAASAWRKLAGHLEGAKRISGNETIQRLKVSSGRSLLSLLTEIKGHEFARERIEPLVEAFCRSADELAARLTNPADKPLSALAADLRRQTAEMHLALYDNGETLRLVPALNAGALEENRTPGDDAAPWLSFQALMLGSPDLLRSYPQAAVKAARAAFAEVKAAYLDRRAADRPARFSAAMDRFGDAVRSLGEQIESRRAKLPIEHRDQELIAATAYPPPGSMDVEVFYNRVDPFFWSWVVSLVASLCLLLAVGAWRRPMFWLGVALLVAAQAFTAAGLGLRGYVTGLVPLTGMFETVVFVALYAALLGLWFALLPLWWPSGRRPDGQPHATRMDGVLERRLFAVAGALVSFLAAVLAYYAPSTVMHRHLGSVAPDSARQFLAGRPRGHDHDRLRLGGDCAHFGQHCLGLLSAGPIYVQHSRGRHSRGRLCYTSAAGLRGAGRFHVYGHSNHRVAAGHRHHSWRAVGRQGLGPLLGLGPQRGLGPDLAAGLPRFSSHATHRLVGPLRHGRDGRARRLCGRLHVVWGKLLAGERDALLRLGGRRPMAGRHGRGRRVAVLACRRAAVSTRD